MKNKLLLQAIGIAGLMSGNTYAESGVSNITEVNQSIESSQYIRINKMPSTSQVEEGIVSRESTNKIPGRDCPCFIICQCGPREQF